MSTLDERQRNTLAAKRWRLRRSRHRTVYQLEADPCALIDFLIRRGYLRDGVTHTRATIEHAVSAMIRDLTS